MSKASTPRPAQTDTIPVQLFAVSPLLLGDDEDVVEEEEIDLLPRRALEKDAVLLHEGRQLSSLNHPPRRRDQWKRLEGREKKGKGPL